MPPLNPVAAVCNQTITVEQPVMVDGHPATNAYGEAVYEDPQVMPARVEEKQNLKRDQQGVERLFSTRVLTVDEILLGALVNGIAVEARENIVDFFGVVWGWRSYL